MFNVVRAQKTYKQRRPDPMERDFIKLFRFTPQNVEWLSQHFLEEVEERRGGALDAKTKMKIFLRYISDPGFQTGVGEDIGVSQPTVSYIIKLVSQKIVEKSNLWIKFPEEVNAINFEKEIWLEKYRFPTAIGVLDCTHVRIKKISHNRHGDEYICRKNFPSINVQATCNANELFTSVNAEWPGSVHDSRIWRNSSICRTLRLFNNAVLLADQGYAIEKCLMTPYKNPRTPQEVAFNNLLKKERVIIERCFGQLKQRFPILQGTVRLGLSSIPTVIVACFILHNVAKYLNDDAVLTDEDYEDQDDEDDGDDDREQMEEMRVQGNNKRRQLAEIIYAE